MGGTSVSYTHLDVYKRQGTVARPTMTLPSSLIISGQLAKNVFHNETEDNTWLKFLFAKLKYDTEATVDDENIDLKIKFKPYIDALPKRIDSVLVWNPEELETLLGGTNLGNSHREKLYSIFKEWYELLKKQPPSSPFFDLNKVETDLLIFENWNETSYDIIYEKLITDTINQTPTIWYSFSGFLWSHLIFISRAFPEYIVNKNCEESAVILLPIIDLMNHHYSSKVSWSSNEEGAFIYQNQMVLEKGDELLNNYGAKGNEELLASYGFVLEDNAFDLVMLRIKLPLPLIEEILINDDGYDIHLPTMEEYTTFAFDQEEKKQDKNATKKTPMDYQDGIIYIINRNNVDVCLRPLIQIFTYLSKTPMESLEDLRPTLEGLEKLRVAIQQKMAPLEREIATANLDPHRYNCATTYRNGQINVLSSASSELKRKEKELMSKNKRNLITVSKISKYDPTFIEVELPNMIPRRLQGTDIEFDSTFDIFVIWIILKIRNNSLPDKYNWVHAQYDTCSTSISLSELQVNDAHAFYNHYFNGIDTVPFEEVERSFKFVVNNSFNTVTSEETILVRQL